MAKIYARADGSICRILHTPELEKQYPDPPEDAAHTLEFDEATNADLVAKMLGQPKAFKFDGAAVRRGAAVRAIAADSQATQDRKSYRALLARAAEGQPLSNTDRDRLLVLMARELSKR